MKRHSIAAAILLAASLPAHSQQGNITWTQTINLPKGQNMPRDRADILGIELGDSYEEAKAKLQKLSAEGIQPKPQSSDIAERMAARMDGQRSGTPPMREDRRIYNLKAPGANSTISASFVDIITINREMTGASGKRYSDAMSVHFSAPSSGHQVIGVSRSITYGADGDQPLISDTVAQLKKKMQFEPQTITTGGIKYRFQFNDGKPYAPPNPTPISCVAGYNVENSVGVKAINQSGDCDALLEMGVQTGISRDHASILYFTLSDNERAKANLTADFAFLADYVRKVQQDMRGSPPKL